MIQRWCATLGLVFLCTLVPALATSPKAIPTEFVKKSRDIYSESLDEILMGSHRHARVHNYRQAVLSHTARKIRHSQHAGCQRAMEANESKKAFYFGLPSQGFGSVLHFWAAALADAAKLQAVLVSVDERALNCSNITSPPGRPSCSVENVSTRWLWDNPSLCGHFKDRRPAPLECFFGESINPCPRALLPGAKGVKANLGCNVFRGCGSDDEHNVEIITGPGFWAPMQYLFSSLSQPLLDLFQEAVYHIFGKEGVPSDIVSVHIRWGDKFIENALVPIEAYVKAVADMRTRHHLPLERTTVFITTEDQAAIRAFQRVTAEKYPSWNIYTHSPAIAQDSREELLGSRGDERDNVYHKLTSGVTSPIAAAARKQSLGARPSLVALLIALEARFCVLTPSSNWSRIIDELHEWVWSWSRRSRGGAVPSGKEKALLALNTETTYLWGQPPPYWWGRRQKDRPAPLDDDTLGRFSLPRTVSKRTTVVVRGFNTATTKPRSVKSFGGAAKNETESKKKKRKGRQRDKKKAPSGLSGPGS